MIAHFYFNKKRSKFLFLNMDEKGESCGCSCLAVSEEKCDSFCSMYFGISCAFLALRLLSKSDKDEERWSTLSDKMLQGSAHLLGLLVWRIQRGAHGKPNALVRKLEAAEKEIEGLKRMRREDARANEKVVGIFASQEQSWLIEKKKLRQHIGALMNELRVVEKKNEEVVPEMNDKLKEMEDLVQFKDKELEGEELKRKELEEKLMKAESVAEELRQTAKREAEEHSNDLWKHKTAFLELVSNQRQLEAEMGRTLRQLEAKRQELDLALEQKEESVLLAQKLSVEVVKLRKDLDQKDKILSAMLRKSKMDTTEKQMLLKEVKLSKVKRKQAELETERWRAASESRVVSESRHERHSLRNMFSHQSNPRSDDSLVTRGVSQIGKGRSQPADYVFEYENPEFRRDTAICSPLSDFYPAEGNDELAISADAKRLEGWVQSEAEKYATTMEKRHQLEIEAFAEQLRLKDEKLEAFRWRLLSMEIESKRLQSHVDGLNQDVSHLRHENMKLEALLERQEELNPVKEQLTVQMKPRIACKTNSNLFVNDLALGPDAIWSQVKIVKRKPIERDPETVTNLMETSQEKDIEKGKEAPNNLHRNATLIVQSPEKEFEEDKGVPDQGSIQGPSASHLEFDTAEKLASPSQPLIKPDNSPWRMDIHALGVSYKIKRLKQQLLMLERLTGKQDSGEVAENDKAQNGMEDFLLLMSLLNKQIGRYQSLQGKTDELCKRMQDNDVGANRGDSSAASTKKETKALEHFLEETFQLQRYMVATGQKLGEVQSKIASGFEALPEELHKPDSFDMKRFADNMRTLFQEVQRGLEVRIARIIGDLEGTLACQGMIRIRR